MTEAAIQVRLVGGVMALAGFFWLCSHVNWLLKTVPTIARITRMIADETGEGTIHFPEFQFTDFAGKSRTVISKTGNEPTFLEVGHDIPIRYVRKNPDIATISGILATGVLQASLFLIGMTVLIFG